MSKKGMHNYFKFNSISTYKSVVNCGRVLKIEYAEEALRGVSRFLSENAYFAKLVVGLGNPS